jgi:Protein of unknown function (DUF4232)
LMGRASLACLALVVLVACPACAPEPGDDTRATSSASGRNASVMDESPTTTSCRSADLALGLTDRVVPPTGQNPLSLTLTNRSARSCYLFGYVQVTEFDAAGRELPFDFKQTGDQVVTPDPPARVDLAPGDTAYVTINKYRCDLGDQDLVSAIQVVPPDGDAPLQVTLTGSSVRLGYCGPGDPGSVVFVSPVAGTLAATIDYGGQRAHPDSISSKSDLLAAGAGCEQATGCPEPDQQAEHVKRRMEPRAQKQGSCERQQDGEVHHAG